MTQGGFVCNVLVVSFLFAHLSLLPSTLLHGDVLVVVARGVQ